MDMISARTVSEHNVVEGKPRGSYGLKIPGAERGAPSLTPTLARPRKDEIL